MHLMKTGSLSYRSENSNLFMTALGTAGLVGLIWINDAMSKGNSARKIDRDDLAEYQCIHHEYSRAGRYFLIK